MTVINGVKRKFLVISKTFIMKVFLLFLALNLNTLACQSQSSDSIENSIGSLNWTSFDIAYTYFSHLSISEDAKKIIMVSNADLNKQLVDDLSIESKTVIIHMILTKVFKLQDTSLIESYVYKNDSITSPVEIVNYTYNNLTWQYSPAKQSYSISADEMDKIKKYWKAKIKN